mgnify:CR=1 FL=1
MTKKRQASSIVNIMEEENMDTWYCNIFPYMDILYILLSSIKTK